MGNCCSRQSGDDQPVNARSSTQHGNDHGSHHSGAGTSQPPQRYEMQPTSARRGQDSRARTSSSLSSGASQNAQNTLKQGRNREFLTRPDGKEYTRTARPGQAKGKWTKVEQASVEVASSSSQPSLQLFLVLQAQAEGEPDHWSLSACDALNGNTRGRVWQVKGDATMMRAVHARNVDVLTSGSYRAHHILNKRLTQEQVAIIDRVAESEPPPSAPNQWAVRENCQGWTIRVLRRLQAEGVVQRSKVDEMEALMQPVR